MAKSRITDAKAREWAASAKQLDKELWLFDDLLEGFAIRCSKGGKAFATYQYWQGGRGGHPRKLSLGEIGEAKDGKLSVAAARELATSAKGKVADGKDPWADKKLVRDRLKAETFRDGWQLYKEAKGKANRTWTEYQRLVDHDVMPKLGNLPLAAITEQHIDGLIEAVTKRKASIGRALFACIRPCFKWLRAKRYIPVNPMAELEQPSPLKKRKRHLSPAEIAAFWRATEQIGFPWQPIFRLHALTACRREEVAALEWRELSGSVWTIPGAKTKNGEPHIIDLPPLALDILQSVPRVHELVFTSTGNTPPSGWSKAKKQLDTLMNEDIGEFPPFRLHDLRRTIKTSLQERHGIPPYVTEAVLNHVKDGIEATYDMATYREERRKALVTWSNYIQTLLTIAKREIESV